MRMQQQQGIPLGRDSISTTIPSTLVSPSTGLQYRSKLYLSPRRLYPSSTVPHPLWPPPHQPHHLRNTRGTLRPNPNIPIPTPRPKQVLDPAHHPPPPTLHPPLSTCTPPSPRQLNHADIARASSCPKRDRAPERTRAEARARGFRVRNRLGI